MQVSFFPLVITQVAVFSWFETTRAIHIPNQLPGPIVHSCAMIVTVENYIQLHNFLNNSTKIKNKINKQKHDYAGHIYY